MFVKTNASRQNGRLGRSIARLSRLCEPLSSCSPPSSSTAPFTLLASRPHPRTSTWQRKTLPATFVRAFATAVDDLPIPVANPDLTKLYNLRPFDPSAIHDLASVAAPKRTPPNVQTIFAVSGEAEVSMSVFEACVSVGKLERAAVVLKRMQANKFLEPEQCIEMHNLYLEAWIRKLKVDPGVGKAEDLHAWYEVHVHSRRLPQTRETIAYMLKASLLTTPTGGTRLTRLVTRYMDMVPPEQALDVLYCTDILTDADVAAITRLYPDLNVADFESDFESDLEAHVDNSELPPVDSEHVAILPETPDVSDGGSSVPEVLPTPQKGSGLRTIKQTISVFNQLKDGYDISRLPYSDRREFQARLERDCIDAAIQRWRETDEQLKAMGMSTFLSVTAMNANLYAWHQGLEAWFKREFDRVKAAEAEEKARPSQADSDRQIYGPILMQSTPSRLAAITTLAVINTFVSKGSEHGIPVAHFVSSIGRIAETDIQCVVREKSTKAELLKRRKEWAIKRQRKVEDKESGLLQEHGKTREDMEKDTAATTDAAVENDAPGKANGKTISALGAASPKKDRLRAWPLSLKVKVGGLLLSAMAEVAKVRVVRKHPVTQEEVVSMQPALSHSMQYKRGRKLGIIIPHPSLNETLRKEPHFVFLARHLPMVVRPEPWSKFRTGAYLNSQVDLVRVKDGEYDQKLYAEAALARGDMEQVTKGLDVLGNTAWRINRPVFDVFLEVWNSGKALAKIPALNPDIPVPEEPGASESPQARYAWMREVKRANNLKVSNHTVRCFMNFQLEVARAFRDQEMYFPHNVDFRGRAYPIPTYLNHMGADHIRGLLRFSKGKELGERGLMWLKIHLANVFGFDKASLKDRAAFADEHVSSVIDSATSPLKGDRWWLTAEDPWQCLAACFELKAALDLPDPTKYVSSLPVHQDGTCNGLQHYAALGGDTWGAKQVNLLPADKPADVYSAVADLVKERLDLDAKIDHPVAKAMLGKIKRKIVKQTVMTNVYGVTFSGAKKQVMKQIVAHYPKLQDETGIAPGLAASYIATHIFSALATMFKGAHDIQFWLGEIGGRVCRAVTAEQLKQLVQSDVEPATAFKKAKTISSKEDVLGLCRSTIVWTTPLRMPVVQPYRKSQTKTVQTCLQRVSLINPDAFDPVSARKQLQAFPPNFIHSLDASHMLLSALECNERGLTFAAVHDSFWTHAADVDVMNRVLRDAFIRIHSEDVIKRLAAEFETRYKGGLYLAKIDGLSAAAQAIRKWRRSNRMSGRDEVVLEKKRIDLLASDDPAEREKGKAMRTAASIYEEMSASSEADIIKEAAEGIAPLGSTTDISLADDDGASDVTDLGEDGDGDDDAAATGKARRGRAADGAAAEEEEEEEGDVLENYGEEEGEEEEAGMKADGGEEQVTAADAEAAAKRLKDKQRYVEFAKKRSFSDVIAQAETSKTTSSKPQLELWLPLSFPKVPEKGDFDVKQLRDSDYFFS